MPADLAPGDVSQTKQTPDSADPVVVFEDVSIIFDIKPVLQNISFTVCRGETRIILGPAGGGKSASPAPTSIRSTPCSSSRFLMAGISAMG